MLSYPEDAEQGGRRGDRPPPPPHTMKLGIFCGRYLKVHRNTTYNILRMANTDGHIAMHCFNVENPSLFTTCGNFMTEKH